MVRKLMPDKREKLLSSALTLFVEQGVQHTSTAEIARKAGTAAGTLFLYFPTKQALIHALVLKIALEQSQYLKSLLLPSLSVRDTFYTIWSGSIHWFIENMEAYRYNQQIRDSGLVDESVVEESGQYLDYFYTAIQKGLNEGRIKPYPLEMIGRILYQDIVAVMNIFATQPDLAIQDEYIQMGFDIFWDGIKRTDDLPVSRNKNDK